MDLLTTRRERDVRAFIFSAAICLLFFAGYTTYSLYEYHLFPTRTGATDQVVARVIQHGVLSVCPQCGSKGIPACPQCTMEMYWNGYQGMFLCPACGKGGIPTCHRCNHPMTWVELK